MSQFNIDKLRSDGWHLLRDRLPSIGIYTHLLLPYFDIFFERFCGILPLLKDDAVVVKRRTPFCKKRTS